MSDDDLTRSWKDPHLRDAGVPHPAGEIMIPERGGTQEMPTLGTTFIICTLPGCNPTLFFGCTY
ncbi:hypothetical protein [Nonomuraea sp. NPDC003201]